MPPDHEFESLGDVLRQPEIRDILDRIFRNRPAEPDPYELTMACEACSDSGYLRRDVQVASPDFGKLFECPCGVVATKRRLRIWLASQIPSTMTGWTLESWLDLPANAGKDSVVGGVRAWLESDRWLLLVGDVGLGKTGLAIAVLLEWMRDGKSGLYVVTPSFLARIRATYRERGDDVDEADVLGSVISAQLLVLDDLGKVRLSEWGQEKLFTVINERYIAGRRTIVTSNLDVDALEDHLWPATWDRIRGLSDVVRLTGESLRGRTG